MTETEKLKLELARAKELLRMAANDCMYTKKKMIYEFLGETLPKPEPQDFNRPMLLK